MINSVKPKSHNTINLEFVGCGNSTSQELGNSSAVITLKNNKRMAIDFGFTAYPAFKNRFGCLPDAVYLTHIHLDHIGGLQSLFYDAYFNKKEPIKIFLHYKQIASFHNIMGRVENIVAGAAANFYDAFQLIPVSDEFWFENVQFTVFEGRHHAPQFSHGISVKGRFAYTGDTKPIPETLLSIASHGEIIFHDLCICEQPSHTFPSELDTYPRHLLDMMIFYHLNSSEDIIRLEEEGHKCAKSGVIYEV